VPSGVCRAMVSALALAGAFGVFPFRPPYSGSVLGLGCLGRYRFGLGRGAVRGRLSRPRFPRSVVFGVLRQPVCALMSFLGLVGRGSSLRWALCRRVSPGGLSCGQVCAFLLSGFSLTVRCWALVCAVCGRFCLVRCGVLLPAWACLFPVRSLWLCCRSTYLFVVSRQDGKAVTYSDVPVKFPNPRIKVSPPIGVQVGVNFRQLV